MPQTPADLHNAIKAVCPIQGLSVGNWADKATWRIDFDQAATPAQRTAAASVVSSFDINAPNNDDLFVADVDRQNLVSQLQNATPAQIKTWVNNNVTDLASARVVLMKILLLIARTIRT